jgi:hypothetical protein
MSPVNKRSGLSGSVPTNKENELHIENITKTITLLTNEERIGVLNDINRISRLKSGLRTIVQVATSAQHVFAAIGRVPDGDDAKPQPEYYHIGINTSAANTHSQRSAIFGSQQSNRSSLSYTHGCFDWSVDG